MGLFANSRYLKQEDVGEEGWVLTIAGINQENVARKDEKPEMKFVLHFAEPDVKPLALNTVNAKMIAKITGIADEDQVLAGAWNGHRILCYQDPNVIMGGETVGGIRIKPVPTSQPRPQQPQQGYRQQPPNPYQQPQGYPPQPAYQPPPQQRQQPPVYQQPPRQAPPGGYPPPPPQAGYVQPQGHQPSMDFDPGDAPPDGRPPGYVPPHPGGAL